MTELKDIDRKIEFVLGRFDFQAVAETMDRVEWKYQHPDGGLRIPDAAHLRVVAGDLLGEVARHHNPAWPSDELTVRSGGFHAIRSGQRLTLLWAQECRSCPDALP